MKEIAILQRTFKKEGLGQIKIARLNNKLMFNLYDACFYLGYTRQAKNKLYLRKDKIINICGILDIKGLSLSDNFKKINYESLEIIALSPSDRDKIKITKDIDFENTWIDEQSFYDLCLESHAKNARSFRRWVTGEVLPSIRKTGFYSMKQSEIQEPRSKRPILEQLQACKFIADDFKINEAIKMSIYKMICEKNGIDSGIIDMIKSDEDDAEEFTIQLSELSKHCVNTYTKSEIITIKEKCISGSKFRTLSKEGKEVMADLFDIVIRNSKETIRIS